MLSRSKPGGQASVLIGCCACNRQGDVFLRFKLGGVYGLRIQVKRCGHLGVAQQALNRLHVLAPANQKRRKAMTKVMESESLTRFQSNADVEDGVWRLWPVLKSMTLIVLKLVASRRLLAAAMRSLHLNNPNNSPRPLRITSGLSIFIMGPYFRSHSSLASGFLLSRMTRNAPRSA